ncbi:MAG: extracellular solute-binding protein [Chloroflexi bacterium]|nr:extracellular solute-binding protein [Chloroflexota bacterium]
MRVGTKSRLHYMIGTLLLAGMIAGACGPAATPPPAATAAPPAPAAAKETWQQEWDRIVAAAKKEGRLSVITDWGPKAREAVIKAVREKYGIDVEITSAGASQAAPKLLAERRAGLYNHDIAVHGGSFGIRFVKPEGVLDPVEPALVLPEVKDAGAWLGGEFPWFDRDRTMIQFFAKLDTHLSVNTVEVRSGEIAAWKDLLAPKWKGKIGLKDPTVVGSGTSWFRGHIKNLGADFMKALARQEPFILRDDRQLVEWLARGKYSALVAGSSDVLNDFIREGSPIAIVDTSDSRVLGAGGGQVMLINRAPHPNTARLFLNWVLTREGQTVMTESVGLPSRRLDAPTGHLLPAIVPQPGKKYTEETEEDTLGGEQYVTMAKDIFGALLSR